MNNILDNIRTQRQLRGISKKEMAERLNISPASYLKSETGATLLSYQRLCEIADIFGMSVIDLITYPDKYILCVGQKKSPIIEELKKLISRYE